MLQEKGKNDLSIETHRKEISLDFLFLFGDNLVQVQYQLTDVSYS